MAKGKALEPTSGKVRLAASGPGNGSHAVFFAGETLVVEYYDHGENAPYESVNQLLFDAAGQRRLLRDAAGSPASEALDALARRFDSYWRVQRECDASGILYARLTDFDV
jgi:hypothetical protein